MRQHEHIPHFEQIKRMEFNATATKKQTKFVLKLRFPRIYMVISLETPWTCKSFVLGAPDESALEPEGKSKYKLYQYLTNQIEKIYAVYDSISDFPLGLLILIVHMYSLKLFEPMCPCGRSFDLSGGPSYGLMPAMFRDMWMRPGFCDIQKHNLCQTGELCGGIARTD